jgi:hydrogenase expression/formation protein HypE
MSGTRHGDGKRPDSFASALNCPLPLRDYQQIVLGHGGGGKLSAELIEHIFLPAFRNEYLAALADSAVVQAGQARLALSTDSYVVRPLRFPGGSIADLAVNGTVNDLCMSGARPLYLTAAFIIEEGFAISDLSRIAADMGNAARKAGVQIVAGDCKVVEKGHCDGLYINTSGLGLVPVAVDISPGLAKPNDAVIVSGTIGDHGMAVMSVREGLSFEAAIKSDSAPLNAMVAAMLECCPKIHVLRDPTRGGLATTLNEIAQASNHGIVIEDQRIPVDPSVQSACEILGFDPMMVANEGKLVCVLPQESAAQVLNCMHSLDVGVNAAIIGKVVDDHPGMVVAKTAIGASRVVTMPIGEQLPRIC